MGLNSYNKILFLDIDGVLNSDRFHRTIMVYNFPHGMEIDPKAIALLKSFLDTYQEIKIVISSSWRDTLSINQFNELFATHGIQDRVIDLTNSDMEKVKSIELWINENNPSHFVIIDDDQLFDLLHRMHRFQIKTSMGLGLQESHIEAIKLFF